MRKITATDNGLSILIQEAANSRWIVTTEKNGRAKTKTCKTTAKMLRYITRVTEKLPFIPSLTAEMSRKGEMINRYNDVLFYEETVE